MRLNVPQLSVTQDVQTRWNSSWYMLAFMLRTNTKVKGLTGDDNTILGNCITLLKPFEEITKTIISENSCLPDEIPLIAKMKAVLNAAIKSKGLSKVTETVMLEIDNRFQNLQNDYAIVTFLDSRYKIKFLEPR